MNLSNAIISIDNLRLRTFIGFNEEEKNKQQDIVVNAELHYPALKASQSDQVDDAVDYKLITKRIIQLVENGRFLLLERLVSEVLEICTENDRVAFAKVKIDKPHALRFADSVSLTMHTSKIAQETENYAHA
jgi:D-erythro-7,8-dihydroneopterin triphosphate epimerase